MRIWAIADLHLSFGIANKSMDIFGPRWEGHANAIQEHWRRVVHPDDLVLIAGDISWAMKLEDAVADLQWIDQLPGTKVMIKGNHDYWWDSLKKVTSVLPPSIHIIQNNAFHWKGVAIAGTRLWDSPEYNFNSYIEFQENPKAKKKLDTEEIIQEDLSSKIFDRELERLKMSLKCMQKEAKLRICMTHYPPISADLQPSRTSQILEEFNVNICVFGHLHNISAKTPPLFGEKNSISYYLTSCDYLHFHPLAIL